MLKKIAGFIFVITFLFCTLNALAAASVAPATGGSAISADTTGGTYATLIGPVITEGTTADIGIGTIILNAPSGFVFNTAVGSVSATRSDVSGTGCNSSRRLLINGSGSQTVTPTATTITINITRATSNSCRNIITFAGILVRPAAGNPLASGNITKSGTASISGVTGSTNFGTLTEVSGAKNKLAFTVQPSATATINTEFSTKPTVAVQDQFGNLKSADSATTVNIAAVLSTQVCGGTAGSGVLTVAPASGAAVTNGLLTYTVMRYSVAQSIKLCVSSIGINSALSNTIIVSAPANPVPTTTSISPSSKTAGDSGFTITVNGTNFISSSVVYFNGASRSTTFGSSTQLTASILTGDLTSSGTFSITVVTPTPGGGTSNGQTFTVNSIPTNPVPTTTSISPSSKTAGDSGFTITVNGTNFISSSVVYFNGASRSTTFGSSTQLTASILTGDLTSSGTFSITVVTPTPGGGTSNGQTFTVNSIPTNPVPTTTSISPSSKTAGDSGFTITVNGTNFISSSVVYFNGASRSTTFGSSTQLTASILTGDLTSSGTFSITVVTPTPGGGTSNGQTFTVNSIPTNPVPTTTSISPSSKTAGDSGFTITVNGTNFISSSVVYFNGASRSTTFGSSTQLTASILTGDLTSSGTFSITVVTPTPGGGTSNGQTFTVNSIPTNPVPTTTSISPSSKTAGDSGFTITVNGTNFISSSVVYFNGASRSTTFGSSTQLTASILTGDLTSSGTFSITVVTPTPGGGTSNGQNFIISDIEIPPPIEVSIPIVAPAGGGRSTPIEVKFSGRAYPGAKLTFVARELRAETPFVKDMPVNADGTFAINFIGELFGPQMWGIIAEDKDGRRTRIQYYNIDAQSDLLGEQVLFLPPTLGFLKATVMKGGFLLVQGYAAPESKLEIQIDGKSLKERPVASEAGYYSTLLNTINYDFGSHKVKARQIDQKEVISDFSAENTFVISRLLFPKTDLNGDGMINIKDWSMFLSIWGSKDENLRKQIDFNGDGKVNLEDFSVFIRTLKK